MSEISNAIKQICSEKGLGYEAVLGTIEAALAAAYRKDFGTRTQNIKVEFDPETAHLKAYDVKTVVEDLPPEEIVSEEGASIIKEEEQPEKAEKRKKKTEPAAEASAEPAPEEAAEEEARKFNPKTEMQLADALMIKPDAQIGEEIRMELEVPGEFGRMAAQTAKQVIIQKLREAERDMVFGEFKDKEKEVVSGVIQRKEGRIVLIDLGKAIGILPSEEQIYGENYRPGSRIKVYVKEVRMGARGAEIILSRTSEEILRKVFYLEIPEVANGLIEIKSVAREAGSRSKVAVSTEAENVDPIGSCVGQRGSRIQTIISELGGEKVDIIEYDSSPEKFIANALSPAKIVEIKVDKDEKRAAVSVNPDQFSLAIGKSGQNVRLAAHLTGWKIDIVENKAKAQKEAGEAEEKVEQEEIEIEEKTETEEEAKEASEEKPEAEKPKKKSRKKEKAEEPAAEGTSEEAI